MSALVAAVVVELEDERVGLAAVDARVVAEELDQLGRPPCDDGLFVLPGPGDVPVSVRATQCSRL